MKRDNYILLFDESGKSKLADEGSYFLLSGIIINKDLHTALSSYMISLKEKSNISADENLHAFDLFENEKIKDRRIPYGKIDTLFDRLCSLIEGADMTCLLFRIDKTPFKKILEKAATKKGVTNKAVAKYLKQYDLHDFLYESLARKMILEFGHFLENEDAHGEIVAESRRQDDEAVLRAFIAATHQTTYPAGATYKSWATSSFKRIHSITFQNKKGLSFGLEIADIFGWAHLNNKYGRLRPVSSKAKKGRIDFRLRKIEALSNALCKKKPEDITRTKLNTVAEDRVSKFTEIIRQYNLPPVTLGTPPGIPDEP